MHEVYSPTEEAAIVHQLHLIERNLSISSGEIINFIHDIEQKYGRVSFYQLEQILRRSNSSIYLLANIFDPQEDPSLTCIDLHSGQPKCHVTAQFSHFLTAEFSQHYKCAS